MKTLQIYCVVDSISRVTKDGNLFGWKVCLRQHSAAQATSLRGNIYPIFHSIDPPFEVNQNITVTFHGGENV